MRLAHWLLVVAVLMAVGWLRVIQQNGVILSGYAVGSLQHDVHVEETTVAWLDAQVQGLRSPTQLARARAERQLKLTAWAALPASLPPHEANVVQLAAAPEPAGD